MKKCCLLLCLLLTPPVFAQGVSLDELEALEGAPEEPQMRRYQVEVIVFAYAEDVGTGSEIFVPELIPEEPESIDELPEEDAAIEDEAATDADPEEPVRFEFALLKEEDFTLTEARERLERLDAYEPLMHFGWIQGMYPDAPTPELPLERFAAPPPGLKGVLNLYLSRYLHLVVDLSLAAEANASVTEPEVPSFGDRWFGDERSYEDVPRYLPLEYRISEDRILKNGETRYYDHPKFGVIAKVLRIEEEEDDEAVAAPGSVAAR